VALDGRSETVRIDGEGRVVVPDELKSHSRISDVVAFAKRPGSKRPAADHEAQA
jgi:DNA-binding transcriptional regulator/RsmH inhibitor MraZ